MLSLSRKPAASPPADRTDSQRSSEEAWEKPCSSSSPIPEGPAEVPEVPAEAAPQQSVPAQAPPAAEEEAGEAPAAAAAARPVRTLQQRFFAALRRPAPTREQINAAFEGTEVSLQLSIDTCQEGSQSAICMSAAACMPARHASERLHNTPAPCQPC